MLCAMTRKERALVSLAALALYLLGNFLEGIRLVNKWQVESVIGVLGLGLIGYVVWRMHSSKKKLRG
jgi:hypothetical protein